MSWRYLAQRALTGEWLSWDLPIDRDELTWALSGPGALRGTVSPDVGHLRASDGSLVLQEWGTLLYAEADGEIRWGGIVVGSSWDGPAWTVEAAGMSTYPNGIPYLGEYSQIDADPAAVYRDVWAYVQAQPDSNLGITVDAISTPARVGTAGSPYALSWWEAPDCGSALDELAKAGPFDYAEEHTWNGNTVAHRIRLGYPRLGRKRDDLAFVQGDNVANVVTAERSGDNYANEVVGIGAGSGRAILQRRAPIRDGRLRRPAIYTDKTISDSDRLDAVIRRELDARRDVLELRTVEVDDHPNAPIGSWQLGDDVLIQASLPWLGDIAVWERVVGWSLISETRASLTLQRSDSFTYGGTA
ncbi:hypothetical protein [Actinoplanes philippinensis]|uniref:hypothetical protein n=1 Tax=Actinoplanes philippinensis TaxID=35752 RepID=UPI0033C421F9